MKTKFLLTIDTECSIGGAFSDPVNSKPIGLQRVLYEKNGESHGLGVLLSTFEEFGLQASFFLEALNVHYFGYEEIGQIAGLLKEKNQDVQLHLHPCWQYFSQTDWQEKLSTTPPNDDFTKLNSETMEKLLADGQAIFAKWGLPAPVALRTGSLKVNRDVYTAMRRCGIRFGSNVGAALFKPAEEALNLYSGCHLVEDCFELPVLSYTDLDFAGKKHFKLLTITGSSWGETEYLLRSAIKQGLDYVVLLTHPFEFIKEFDRNRFVVNKINKKRLVQLCKFLQANTDQLETTTFSALHKTTPIPSSANVLLKTPPLLSIKRMFENYANDKIGSL
jgi:hypothetical protein